MFNAIIHDGGKYDGFSARIDGESLGCPLGEDAPCGICKNEGTELCKTCHFLNDFQNWEQDLDKIWGDYFKRGN